jgi:hypothetical protein
MYDIDWNATTVSPTGYSSLVNLGATCFLRRLWNSSLRLFRSAIAIFIGHLILSKGHSISPASLAAQWTDWDSHPINRRVQLISKLETGLDEEYIEQLFVGTNVNIIEGITDPYRVTKHEPHTVLTLPIAGYTTTDAAFAMFQVPDFLIGEHQYEVESLGKLPLVLIVRLGRFTYDYVRWTSAFCRPLRRSARISRSVSRSPALLCTLALRGRHMCQS